MIWLALSGALAALACDPAEGDGAAFRKGGGIWINNGLEGRTCGGLPPESCGFTPWGRCDAPGRCIPVDGHPTQCAAGLDPLAAPRLRSISTYVAPLGGQ